MYYNNNNIDTASKDLLSGKILDKVTIQKVDSMAFESPFNVFKKNELETGNQIEEIEVGNLTSEDFDATGANALTKKNMDFKALYHKINRRKTMPATVSDAQIKMAMLSKENTAKVANAIATEMQSSSQIEDFEAFKQLLVDIAGTAKNMVICDLNGNGSNIDALTKAVQVVGKNMQFPKTQYNYSGFKKAFSRKDDLVLIMDSTLDARISVDSLATAFNLDKKKLADNIIVVDDLPNIEYAGEQAYAGLSFNIGTDSEIKMYKAGAEGESQVTGKALMFLIDKRALVVDPVERVMTEQYNAKGRFTNKYLHSTDILSYSTLKNAVVFVD